MESQAKFPKTLQAAIVYFADPERSFQFALTLRWPDGKVSCPRCGSQEHSFVSTRRLWFCKGCKKQFTIKVGTIFEDSPLGMDKWMTAVWLIANCKNGISSYEIARDLGITQKSAWFMLHRIRKAMQDGSLVKLGGNGGEVEVDETFIGGKARNMHKSRKIGKGYQHRGIVNKTIVMGMLERGGNVTTKVIQDRETGTLHAHVAECIEAGTTVYSDEWKSYNGLSELDENYKHQVINHAEKYVDGRVHTNGLENFWSLTKRTLAGTYVSVEPFHLFRYLDEQSFRYNNRKTAANPLTDADRFTLAMSNVFGRRLTWNQLTGKEVSPTPVN
jgi:transposase-like protein